MSDSRGISAALAVGVGALAGAVPMPRARVVFGATHRLGLGSRIPSLVPPCSLSPAWGAAGKLGTAKVYLGSGQTCPGVRLHFNIVNLSRKGRG